LALAHKRLNANCIAWRFSDKQKIAFSGQGAVPVLVDHGQSIHDSWRIAKHLEENYPSQSLFGNASASLVQFVNAWADRALVPAIAQIVILDVFNGLHEQDKAYFRASREKMLGASLEAVVEDKPTKITKLKRVLAPLRQALGEQAYLGGNAANYADYCVFGMFMWARCVSPSELLEKEDPIYTWRERLLDAFDGMARAAFTVSENQRLKVTYP